jgi:hypothetical protein
MHALIRTLAAALSVVALAAPVASARIDPPTPTAPSEQTQDLRHLRAGQSHVGDPGPVYWSYEYEAPTPAAHPATPGDGIPWMTLGFGVAGACLLISAAAVLTTRTRTRSARVA